MFKDRQDAGIQLAEVLAAMELQDPLILGIPRGGVEVAYEIAIRLGAKLDVTVPRKVGAPQNPELAVGAVTEDGTVLLNENLIAVLGIPKAEIMGRAEQERQEIERRTKLYRAGGTAPAVAGRDVILVDDGIATGFTVKAALKALRLADARRLILAVPVAPADTIADLRQAGTEVVVLYAPQDFTAVGNFYKDFAQTTDEQVVRLLENTCTEGGQH